MSQGQHQAARFTELAKQARIIWAKSGQSAGHGLLAHLLDVAAVAEALLEHEPPATRRLIALGFRLDEPLVGRWVAALVGLHDFGKATPGFQAKWPDGQLQDERRGLEFRLIALKHDNHSLATASLLVEPLAELTGTAWQWCKHVVQAISAHHGYHFQAVDVDDGRPRHESKEWAAARETILRAYWQTLRPQGVPAASALRLPVVNWLAGLTSAADWIASNPLWFPQGERRDVFVDYYAHAKELAEQALQRIGWSKYRPLLDADASTNKLLSRIVRRDAMMARPLQNLGDELLRSVNGPALLLVEAPMGEGKTELAFLAHLRLQAANQHRGLYLALPTQATGNALFKRAAAFLESFAPGPLDVQLVHGGAAMNEDLAMLRDINHSTQDTLSASAWFGQRRRPLLSPYGVGTVDQALYAVLNVKHHFVRLWGLSNRVVVLDEVHAYDTYTSGLISMLLRWLKALGCSVVLMSATLPRARRNELLEAWGVDPKRTPELEYPRLVLADDAGARGRAVPSRPLAPIELSGLDTSIAALAEAAVSGVAQGGCGAVIVNTVQRAQSLYQALKARLFVNGADDVVLLLIHARFPADERGALEERVRSLFGPSVDRPAQALLVATQVVEQSLDIDFDFMLSDLAPVDLLLQRAGRLHRHQRPRPAAHAQARLHVAGLLPGPMPDLKATAWEYVYDRYVLGRTWALLLDERMLTLPDDIDRLVQAVYDTDIELPGDLEQAARDFIEVESFGAYRARVRKERSESFNVAIHPDAEPQEAYASKPRGHEEDELGLGLENRTRLGRETVTVVPVYLGEGGHWHVQVGDRGFLPDEPVDGDTARALYGRHLKLAGKAVVHYFQAQQPTPAFSSHPLLRHMHPLQLRNGRSVDERLRIELCLERGLVFVRGDKLVNADQGEA